MHYAAWYPTLFVPRGRGKFSSFGKLGKHLKFAERASRQLARAIFHAMAIYQAKLERKQRTLFRIVDIGTDLFAMSASITYAQHLAKQGGATANAHDLADQFCREARLRIERNFATLFDNFDDQSYKVAMSFMKGEYQWAEGLLVEGIVPTPETVEAAIRSMA